MAPCALPGTQHAHGLPAFKGAVSSHSLLNAETKLSTGRSLTFSEKQFLPSLGYHDVQLTPWDVLLGLTGCPPSLPVNSSIFQPLPKHQ